MDISNSRSQTVQHILTACENEVYEKIADGTDTETGEKKTLFYDRERSKCWIVPTNRLSREIVISNTTTFVTETYQHYKGGLYDKFAEGQDVETTVMMVWYRSKDTGLHWVRPSKMFFEIVPMPVPRFQKI